MANRLDRRLSLSFNKEDHPGCMWGILHILHFHQWHNVKKRLPHRRIGSRQGIRYSRLRKSAIDSSEAQQSPIAEMDDPRMSDSSPSSSKKSGIAHKKKLIAEGLSKGQDQKYQLPYSPSRFNRTDSIHHLQPSHHSLPDQVREHIHQSYAGSDACNALDLFLPKSMEEPVASYSHCEVCDTIVSVKTLRQNHLNELGRQFLDNALLQDNLDKATEALEELKSMEGKHLLKDVALQQSKELLHTVEILNVNKELLLKILKDPNYDLSRHFQTLEASYAKQGLTRSETFPVTEPLSRKMNYNKTKSNRRDYGGLFDNFAASILKTSQHSLAVGRASSGPAPIPMVELKKQGANQVVVSRFKSIRQKIKQAIKESRKEGRRISMDAILHKIPYGRRNSKDTKREIVDKWREVVRDAKASNVSDISATSPGKDGVGRMRRTHSLNESLDKYSQLFESSFSNEAKQNVSDKLKLTNEDRASSSGSAPKTMARILSLPDLGAYHSCRNDASGDVLSPGTPSRVLVDSNANGESTAENQEKPVGLPVHRENEVQVDVPLDNDQVGLKLDSTGDGISTLDKMEDDLNDHMNKEDVNSQNEKEIGPTNNVDHELPQPSSSFDPPSCFQEDTSNLAGCLTTEGSELKPNFVHLEGLKEDPSVLDSLSRAVSNLQKVKVPSRHFDSEGPHLQVNKKDEADFYYVRDVLTLSGFSVNEYLGTWHSPEHPVDPSLFEEVEVCSPLKPHPLADDAVSNYDHQLLFDIINEVLLDIHERSFFYCPWPLSRSCHIRPMPMGYHVLEEVWTTISWYMGSQPELEPSLDYVVSRDLAKDDGWMNLQFESECVGLQLEEMLLDDLLDEILDEVIY